MILELPDLKIRNPYMALAIEDAIAEYTGQNGKALGISGFIRLWSNSYAIVFGRTCDARKNIRPDVLDRFEPSLNPLKWKKNPVITRRVSGGGTVLHGPGNINFSVFLPMDAHPDLYPVRQSYRIFLSMVVASLEAQGIRCGVDGLSDVVLDPEGDKRKISGNAQFRKYGMIVHHGTLLIQQDIIPLISRFLNHPPSEPEYRRHRAHGDFLSHLPDSFDLGGFYYALLARLKEYVRAESTLCPVAIKREIVARAKQKVRDVYARREWILEGAAPELAGHRS